MARRRVRVSHVVAKRYAAFGLHRCERLSHDVADASDVYLRLPNLCLRFT